MAVELPARRQNVTTSVAVATYPSVLVPRIPVRTAGELRLSRQTLVRALEIIPGAAALFLISSLVWGYIWFPTELAVALLVFDVYWLWKSWTIAYHVRKGVRLMREAQARDWRADHAMQAARDPDILPWGDIRHVVIIPNCWPWKRRRATRHAGGPGF